MMSITSSANSLGSAIGRLIRDHLTFAEREEVAVLFLPDRLQSGDLPPLLVGIVATTSVVPASA